MEKISIQNFAGIKSMDFEFKAINILIGPQGSGKSVTVKLHYFFRSFFRELSKGEIMEGSTRDLENRQKKRFATFFPKDSWPDGDFRIVYNFNETQVAIEKVNKQLKFNYSDDLKNAIRNIKKMYADEIKEVKSKISLRNFSHKKSLLGRIGELIIKEIGFTYHNEQIFIPAGRSFFANIQNSIFSLLNDRNSLDPFFIEFGAEYENLKHFYSEHLVEMSKDKAINKIIAEILSGDYIREKEEDFLVHKDKRKVSLSNASSGQQETLPLVIILKALSVTEFNYKNATIYIEEPEAHLFPNAQKAIVQLLARVFNKGENFQIFVTTHSPYILSSFNNLIEAGRLSELKPAQSKDIAKIIPVADQLKPGLLTAYAINNSRKENLIDKETNLITQTVLDNISNDIAIEFGKLLDIEFNGKL